MAKGGPRAAVAQVVAGELSPQRAELIRHNVRLLGAQARVRVLCADFWQSIRQVQVPRQPCRHRS